MTGCPFLSLLLGLPGWAAESFRFKIFRRYPQVFVSADMGEEGELAPAPALAYGGGVGEQALAGAGVRSGVVSAHSHASQAVAAW